jgi:tripartite-type tricarboxylate transporter receptor subunit TctC
LRQLPHLLFPTLVIASSAATAQVYPNRPIHIIVPYAAGGAIDSTARILAERLGPSLRQTLIIENKPGAAGKIAAEFVSQAEPDGTQFSIRLVLTWPCCKTGPARLRVFGI